MIIIPAIDLRGGRCVRLLQGDFERMTVYSDDPVAMALTWRTGGAKRLHLVDLDGSLAGTPLNREVVGRIVREVGLPVQVGGGIRDLQALEAYLAMGVRWVIIGTAALRDPAFVRNACRLFPGHIILGIDAADGHVAVQGWTEKTAETAVALASRLADAGPAAIVYTDIARDGMQTGVNVEATGALAAAVGIPVIASGGVADLTDVDRLLTVEGLGVMGMIVGKALYTGALVLSEAISRAAVKPPADGRS